MRRAKQCRYFASSLPPNYRHSRLTIVRRGCCQVATRRDSWRSHVHRTYTAQRVQSFKLQTRNVRGQGARPLAFSWGSKGAILSRERMAPLSAHPAARREQSAEHRAAKNILPFSKEKRTPRKRRSSYFCESKIYRYFCMPSVARAGSPETEMVNLTPVALLKRSSSFRKSSAAWLHSPPVILNRLSMKMWEIS